SIVGRGRRRPHGVRDVLAVDRPSRWATPRHAVAGHLGRRGASFCTGTEEQKSKNLASNPSCILTTGTNRLHTGLDVVVEGTARRVTDTDNFDSWPGCGGQSWTGRSRSATESSAISRAGWG